MFLIKSDKIPLHGAADSLQGGRLENQDDFGFWDTPLGFLFIVCDGMGGGPGGKTASYLVKYEIAQALSECNPQMPREKAIKMAVSKANDALFEKMEKVPALSGMGSTFVAVLINEQSAIIAHAGDSRCYRIHGKRVLYRTPDHSLVGELLRKKVLTEEQARISPQANVISRGLGSTTNHVPEIVEVPYRKGDRFILCTDGVWGSMIHKDLLKHFSEKMDCKMIVRSLSEEIDKIGVAKGGHHDNHTLGIIEMDSNSILKDRWSKWNLYILGVIAVCLLVTTFVTLALKQCGDWGKGQISASSDQVTNIASREEIIKTRGSQNDVRSRVLTESSVRAILNGKSEECQDSIKQPSETGDSYDKRSVEILQKIINRLDSMSLLKMKSAKVNPVAKKQENKVKEIKNLLKELESEIDAEHQEEVSHISQYVDKQSNEMIKIMEKNGVFCPTRPAINIMNATKKKIEELKSKLNKENYGNNKTSR